MADATAQLRLSRASLSQLDRLRGEVLAGGYDASRRLVVESLIAFTPAPAVEGMCRHYVMAQARREAST